MQTILNGALDATIFYFFILILSPLISIILSKIGIFMSPYFVTAWISIGILITSIIDQDWPFTMASVALFLTAGYLWSKNNSQ